MFIDARREPLFFTLVVLVPIVLAGPAPAAGARSRAPRPWRADQVQRLDAERPPVRGTADDLRGAERVLMAGDPNGAPPDTPAARVDPNVASSPFAGVCSLLLHHPSGATGLCTGTPISPRHILTAAHCFDWDDDGTNDLGFELTVVFNDDGDASHTVHVGGILGVDLHPDFTGFANPSPNDDLAIITLVDPLPAAIPIYPPFRGQLGQGERITLVGYGDSGTGIAGPSVDADASVKRTGANLAERFFDDDEDGPALEIWQIDFDAPEPGLSCFGAPSLGNAIETTAGSGDSGGPSFVEVEGVLHVWGVNTFVNACLGPAHQFGSRTGGLAVNAYLAWIDTIVECGGNCADCNENGVPDGWDILNGTSPDEDDNGRPDECPFVAPGDVWMTNFIRLHAHSFAYDLDTELPFNLSNARGLVVDDEHRLYVAGSTILDGSFVQGVLRFDAVTGAFIDVFVDGLSGARDLLFGPDGLLYVLNGTSPFTGPHEIRRHDPVTGALVDVFVADDPDTPEPENGGTIAARRLAFGPAGDLHLASEDHPGLARFDGASGAFLGFWADGEPGLFGTSGVLFHGDRLLLSDVPTGTVRSYDPVSGAPLGVFIDADVGGPGTPGQLRIGPDGDLYLLRQGQTDRLLRFDPATGELREEVFQLAVFSLQSFAFVPRTRPEDLDGDGVVGANDLNLLLAAWGPCAGSPCAGDLDADGGVGFEDLVRLLRAWG